MKFTTVSTLRGGALESEVMVINMNGLFLKEFMNKKFRHSSIAIVESRKWVFVLDCKLLL